MTAPLWQAGATRLAALPARQRRWALFALLVMLLLAAVAAPRGDVPGEPLYAALLSGMRYASGFYDGLADLLRADPAARPLGLFPPALAIVDSSLPGWATMLLLAAALTGWLWIGMLRLVPLFARGGAQALAIALLALGAVAGALLWTDAPHAGWVRGFSSVQRGQPHCAGWASSSAASWSCASLSRSHIRLCART